MVVTAVDLDRLSQDLRELLTRVDSLLDDPLPVHAAAEANAVHDQLERMIEDTLDLIEVEEALKEAGDERISLDQVMADLGRA